MIKIENLGFSYGQFPVLKNISMQLSEGNIYGLLGENGVGKTIVNFQMYAHNRRLLTMDR